MRYDELAGHALTYMMLEAAGWAQGQGSTVLASIDLWADLPADAPYCAAALVAAFRKAGHCPWLADGAPCYVPSLLAWASSKGWAFGPAQGGLLPGDLTIYGQGDHVGMVRLAPQSDLVLTVEGNTTVAGAGGPTGVFLRGQSRSGGWLTNFVVWPKIDVPGFPGPAT